MALFTIIIAILAWMLVDQLGHVNMQMIFGEVTHARGRRGPLGEEKAEETERQEGQEDCDEVDGTGAEGEQSGWG